MRNFKITQRCQWDIRLSAGYEMLFGIWLPTFRDNLSGLIPKIQALQEES
jgi:hypothetical protein